MRSARPGSALSLVGITSFFDAPHMGVFLRRRPRLGRRGPSPATAGGAHRLVAISLHLTKEGGGLPAAHHLLRQTASHWDQLPALGGARRVTTSRGPANSWNRSRVRSSSSSAA